MDQDCDERHLEVCRLSEEFTKLYYNIIDNKRHVMSKLYLGKGTLVWNGNGMIGIKKIQKFFSNLPPSEHILTTLEGESLNDLLDAQTTFLFQVRGLVTYQKKTPKSFFQTFMVTIIENQWKIISDSFKLQDQV